MRARILAFCLLIRDMGEPVIEIGRARKVFNAVLIVSEWILYCSLTPTRLDPIQPFYVTLDGEVANRTLVER